MGVYSAAENDTLAVGALRLNGTDILANGEELNEFSLDLSTRDLMTSSSVYGYVPYKSEFVKAFIVLNDAFTGSDNTFQVRDSDGNQMGSITVTAGGSGAGQMYLITGTANLDFAAGDKVQFLTDGAGTGPTGGSITFIFKRVE